ncbi:serine protease [Luteimonas sp. M1R5S18]|uniref:Serine protease n=1 Tax=Luteimonas rhizosphaericola TaxID=3042024 RepID=A0ABT6JFT2_9GAMM|nr:serine protease [Luteimonas rhizosphaericola]MDH5829273.1 serine protease [Luteimonas rhizosphaericola]
MQDNFRHWTRRTFSDYRGAVAYIASTDNIGAEEIGTAFHVGDGVFVTARHVVEGRDIKEVGFDDDSNIYLRSKQAARSKTLTLPSIGITSGPFFHIDSKTDVACFTLSITPDAFIPLGGHLDDWLGQYELVLYRTLALGYPPIPLSSRPNLFASSGEVNALVELYSGTRHPHFLISSMARGGFSGGPVMVAYNEDNADGGTALLGLVTQSLVRDHSSTETGYFAVLTIEPIYDCLKQHGLLPAFQNYDPDYE